MTYYDYAVLIDSTMVDANIYLELYSMTAVTTDRFTSRQQERSE